MDVDMMFVRIKLIPLGDLTGTNLKRRESVWWKIIVDLYSKTEISRDLQFGPLAEFCS
jgi:hypothetical protein